MLLLNVFLVFAHTSKLTITHSLIKPYSAGLVRCRGLMLTFIDSSRRDLHDYLDLILEMWR